MSRRVEHSEDAGCAAQRETARIYELRQTHNKPQACGRMECVCVDTSNQTFMTGSVLQFKSECPKPHLNVGVSHPRPVKMYGRGLPGWSFKQRSETERCPHLSEEKSGGRRQEEVPVDIQHPCAKRSPGPGAQIHTQRIHSLILPQRHEADFSHNPARACVHVCVRARISSDTLAGAAELERDPLPDPVRAAAPPGTPPLRLDARLLLPNMRSAAASCPRARLSHVAVSVRFPVRSTLLLE
ncbi:unnamed protein product [Pleuronectes platessa]|uniref:Uncharacterized protein n=1 Tax=Pleuronectes platessa TaxID=8262 RepID=A0A9N7VAF4_PLEPL|nr:unnamed protein product [Pleuronectes platessa]